MRIYISGPITGHPDHVQVFAKYAKKLRDQGHDPLDPHDVPVFPHSGACPPGARNGDDDPHTWPCYLRADVRAMLECDLVILLPGWRQSRGAQFEQDIAFRCGMPVYTEWEWF